MKRSGFSQRTKPMTSASIKQKTPSASTGILRTAAAGKRAPARKAAMKAKQSGKATAAERAHMGRVAALGCCLCEFLNYGNTPAEVHHVRKRHGWGRSGHLATIPLCPEHHRGQPGGVHDMGRLQFAEHYGISEFELLERVMRRLQVSEGEAAVTATPSNQK